MGKTPPGGRPNVNVDPHVGLIRLQHPLGEGCGAGFTREALTNALFADFMTMKEQLNIFLLWNYIRQPICIYIGFVLSSQ